MTNYNGKLKNADTNYETDYNQMITLGIASSNNNYWLASRSVGSDSVACDFYVRFVLTPDNLFYTNLCNVDSNGSSYGVSRLVGFRPVLTLKSGIKVTEGDGDTTPYTLAA